MFNELLVFVLFGSLPFVYILFLLCVFVHWLLFGCRFEYRNPYDRTCRICGRHEIGHSWPGDNKWYWECFDNGDKSKH